MKEAVLTTMTEWCTCTLLLSTSLLRATKKGTTKDNQGDQEEQSIKFEAEEK